MQIGDIVGSILPDAERPPGHAACCFFLRRAFLIYKAVPLASLQPGSVAVNDREARDGLPFNDGQRLAIGFLSFSLPGFAGAFQRPL